MEDKVRLLKLPVRKTRKTNNNLLCKNIGAMYKTVIYQIIRYWKPIAIVIALITVLLWTHSSSKSHLKYSSGPNLNTNEYFSKLLTIPNYLLNSLNTKKPKIDSEYIKLLHWTPYYESIDFGFDHFGCSKNRKCKITFDQEEIETVDAVIFSAVDLQYEKREGGGYTTRNMPASDLRKPDVPWIISLFESPEHVPVDLRLFHGVFNYTWSFRRDSDFPGGNAYERLGNNSAIYENSIEKIQGAIDLSKKNRTAAWIVSNCDMQPSNRNYLAKLLQKYIDIDVYGSCGTKSCSNGTGGARGDCYGKIGKYYKFYLSFENSLCFDYVTEKFPAALDAGMVPVVYGFGNITEPKGAFINVFDYDSVEHLAKHLMYLNENPEEYAKYFEWRKFYRRVPQNSFLCPVCEKMWEWREKSKDRNSAKQQKNYEFLWDWWVHTTNNKGQKIWACSRPGYHLHNLKRIFTSWWDWES